MAAKLANLCNAALFIAAEYISKRAKEQVDVGSCVRLVMQSEHIVHSNCNAHQKIVLAALALLHLARFKVMYFKAKDPRKHLRGVSAPENSRGQMSFLTPVPEALFSKVNRLWLFDIVRSHCFGASELWLSFRRS